MNIYEATLKATNTSLIIKKRGRSQSYWFYVTASGIYRNRNGIEICLNAKDCIGNDWFLVNKEGEEVAT